MVQPATKAFPFDDHVDDLGVEISGRRKSASEASMIPLDKLLVLVHLFKSFNIYGIKTDLLSHAS